MVEAAGCAGAACRVVQKSIKGWMTGPRTAEKLKPEFLIQTSLPPANSSAPAGLDRWSLEGCVTAGTLGRFRFAADRGSGLRIQILGPVFVDDEGQIRAIRANKVRALLATLALEAGRAVSSEDLVDELWSGTAIGNARNALQATVTRLRRAIEPAARRRGGSVLRGVNNGYLLEMSPEHVDGNRFLELAAQGAAHLGTRPARALELLQSALDVWHGPALLDAGDGLRVRGAAALFDERRLTVREDLVSALLAVGDEARAIAELRRLVALHPQRERFCELLMLALYRTGRQGEALDLFRWARRRLDEELGIRPGAPLQRLHAEILAQDPALRLPAAVLPGQGVPAAVR
jgi:DNA-binding SARP family transcriptional activator